MEVAAYPWQRRSKDGGDVAAAEIACREDEHSSVACSKGRNLQRAVSQPLILGEHDPPTLADRLEPDAIFLVASEMIVVNLDDEARSHEFRTDRPYA